MSLHIGEWWQGLKYRGYWDDARAAVEHFGSRPGFSPQLFGWFDIGMRDGAGTVARPPLFGSASVDWIHPVRSQWQLHGGGGFTMPCLGVSMVKMHGVEGGGAGQVWPPLPVGADGGECWSSARPLVLRVNTEARCEPDLSVRPADYDPVPFTAAFWSRFDAAAPRPAREWIGGEHLPLFPYATYRGARARYPFIMMRRGEFAVFTVDELASATPPPVPWSNLSYPVAGAAVGGTRPGLSARFLDPDRVDPFGGATYGAGTVDLYNSDLHATECVELGEPGWDAVSGTLRVDCAHGRENSPNTGRVNRAVMGHGTRQRAREVGPVDNSRSYGGRAVARRSAGLWTPPAGFGWFEHRNATLGCVFFRANTRGDHLARRAEYFREQRLHMMGRSYRRWFAARERLARCTGDRCRATERANMAFARFWGRRYFREAYGWEIIRDYREWAARRMERALRSARYPYRIESARRLVANGRVLGDGGNACITNLGPGRYTEVLIPSYPTFESSGGRTAWASQASIPGQGGRMWYGAAFGAYGAPRRRPGRGPLHAVCRRRRPDDFLLRVGDQSRLPVPGGASAVRQLQRRPHGQFGVAGLRLQDRPRGLLRYGSDCDRSYDSGSSRGTRSCVAPAGFAYRCRRHDGDAVLERHALRCRSRVRRARCGRDPAVFRPGCRPRRVQHAGASEW